VGASSPGQVGQSRGSDDSRPSDFSELGPACGLARQAYRGGMGCAGRAASSAATASFGCSRAGPVLGCSGRLSGCGARTDLGRADGSGSRRSRRRSNVGIAAAASGRGTRARLGGTGSTATGRRGTGARLGCTGTARAPRGGSRAQLGRARTFRFAGSAGRRTSPRATGAGMGRTAGARRATPDRHAAACLESTGGAVLGSAQAR
jgi:hypothetical protein